MKAGQTNIEVGTRVKIKNLTGEDKTLNGMTGTVTHPFAFGCTKKGWVGVWLDSTTAVMPYGGQMNIKVTECEIIKETHEAAN